MLEVKDRHDGKGQCLTATQPIAAGQVFHQIESYHYIAEPTFYRVKVSASKRIEEFEYMGYL